MSELGITADKTKESVALLIGVYRAKELKTCEEHLEELADLADTFGIQVGGRISCPIRKIDAATYLGEGKLREIKERIDEFGVSIVIFDEEISPAQQRNLEKLLKVAVMDRTELILEIFAGRAQTKEAKLQIELAQTKYEFPRLKRLWSHFSRQRASGGYLKGEGEKQIEIDRRLLSLKIEKLQSELKQVEKSREIQKQARQRSEIPTFALIGYTNAGKSTLLNALTQANVFVEDKLFATLDPTTRKFTLPNNQEVLLTDTVGFIRKLPHTLVAAFKSTLESALHDDVLLHVVDASHKNALEHSKATYEILKELKSENQPIITVLNKSDRCNIETLNHLRILYPKTVVISAIGGEGLDDLLHLMLMELEKRRKMVKLRIPQEKYGLVSELRRKGHVHYEEYEGNDVILKVEVPLVFLHRVEQYRLK